MSGITIFVIVIVLIFVGGMVGLLVYMNTGKDENDAKERKPKP